VTTTYSYYGPRTNNLTVTDTYKYIASGNDYYMASLSLSGQQKMLISGGANRIYVAGRVSITGQGQIVIAPGSSVIFYVGGDGNFAGNGVLNEDDKAVNLQIFGLPTCTSMSLSGNGRFTGVIYAPNADFTFNGGGNNGQFIGALVAKSITVNGVHGMDFIYDEALGGQFAVAYRPTAWKEEAVGTLP